MEDYVYLVVVKNFFTERSYEYQSAISHDNITVCNSLELARIKAATGITQLREYGYANLKEMNLESDPFTCYQCRMERGDGRAAVIDIYKKSINTL